VLVVDDFSEDATAHIARDAGARVVRPDQRPPGWTGKTWACWSGACQARGDVLLFLDADVWFEHDGLRMLLDTFNSAPGALSALPYQHACKPHEHLSAVFVMAMAAGTGAFSPLGGNPAGLFGPCMMCRREDYFLAGGHKAVRSEVLEHLMMGSRFAAAGVPVRLCRGKDAVAVRMYAGGVRELIDGWAKAFASGAAVSSRPGKTLFVLWIVGAVLLSAAMAIGAVRAKSLSGLWRLAAAAYGVHAAVFYRNARLAGAFSPLAALAFPVTILFFIGVFIRSAALASGVGSVRWRGRTISREADA
jgi:4,4'-diaponeurosporenoate glycosyltransferase